MPSTTRARRARRAVAAAAAMAATVAAAVTVSAGPAAAPAGADTGFFDTCPALVLYGSRGSGEPGPGQPPAPGQPDRHGLGLALWELYEALAATRPAGEVGYVANDYPAVDPVDALPDVAPYVASVTAGVAGLRADVPAIAAECPAAKIAVVGYSQGADVTRRGVDALANPGGRIKVVQLSDPHFDASEATVAYTGNFDPTWRGLARNLADLGLFSHAPTFRAEWGVESWCHGADLVCQYPAGTLDTHVDYLQRDVPAVAWRIARWAGLGSTTPIPTAYAEGVSCVGSFPSRNRATFRLSAAGSPPGTSVTLRAVVDGSTQVPAIAVLGPTGTATWTPELPLGSRPRYRIYWGSTLLLDQHMTPAC